MRLHEWYVEKQLSRAHGDPRTTVRSLYVFQAAMLAAATLGMLTLGTRLLRDDGLTLVRGFFIVFWSFIAYSVVRQHLYLRRRLRTLSER